MFVDNLKFRNANSQILKVIDLTQTNEMPETNKAVSLFDKTVEFTYEEVRNYLFWLKPLDPNIKLNNNDSHVLGALEISWKSYLGD